MKVSRWGMVVVAACICGALVSGCSSRNGKRGGVDDVLNLDEYDTDVALGERFEDGILITDVQFDNVHFSYDSFQIQPSEIQRIEAVADYMRSNGGAKLVTEGHCDERGSREYNLALGEHRSLAVRAHLVRLGIDGIRIQTRSYGEEQPANPGHEESAWRLNRRVEFKLYR